MDLVEATARAVVDSIAHSPPGGIGGYALILDNGIHWAIGASISHSFAVDPANEDTMFTPENWKTEHVGRPFRDVGTLIQEVADGPYETRAATIVRSLVGGLQRARDAEPALRDAILIVVCADGGGVWDEIEREAMQQLNSPEIYERWRARVEHWRLVLEKQRERLA